MTVEDTLRQEMLASIPHLRAFAISLTGSVDRADDLVQETLLRGLDKLEQFSAGTSMQAWLFTILRNQFFTQLRRRSREMEDPDGLISAKLVVLPEQEGCVSHADLLAALTRLPVAQREALLLVAAEGASYEEAARLCETNIGTIKSRVNRARRRLAELLALDPQTDLGRDPLVDSALSTSW
jgi:RNA polymerase sigma-70 factor (ECF subfamily)